MRQDSAPRTRRTAIVAWVQLAGIVMFVAGGAVLVYGVALLTVPGGCIAAGVLVMICAVVVTVFAFLVERASDAS